jgi:hypothetical protein
MIILSYTNRANRKEGRYNTSMSHTGCFCFEFPPMLGFTFGGPLLRVTEDIKSIRVVSNRLDNISMKNIVSRFITRQSERHNGDAERKA